MRLRGCGLGGNGCESVDEVDERLWEVGVMDGIVGVVVWCGLVVLKLDGGDGRLA
jgi:repressor of nif and glnA expression